MSQVEMQQAAQDCMNCHDVCLQTVQQCQQAGGQHAQESHIQMMQDCAELCQRPLIFCNMARQLPPQFVTQPRK